MVFCICIATGMAIQTHFLIPTNAQFTVPGNVISIEQDVMLKGKSNLHKVGVINFLVIERMDFYRFMWENKKLVSEYSYREYKSKDELVDEFSTNVEYYKEIKVEKYSHLIDYLVTIYPEEEVGKMIEHLKIHNETAGNSDALAIMLALIGMKEEKNWLDSKERIVITGTLDAEGNVLPVGDIYLKSLTAIKSKADILIIPSGNVQQLEAVDEKELQIVPVTTIEEAIFWMDQNIK